MLLKLDMGPVAPLPEAFYTPPNFAPGQTATWQATAYEEQDEEHDAMTVADTTTGELERQLGDPAVLPLFDGLPRWAVLAALRGSKILNLAAGATLLKPGESNSSMYVLLSGELAAHLDTHADAQQLATDAIPILAGECVGELSALDGKPTSALVVAQSAARVLEIPGAVFRNQVLTLPGVAGNLLLALTERMRKANVAALKTQREQLELQHLRKELQIARQLQLDMVPALNSPLFPQRQDIDACGAMTPAPKVGGSLFDCFFAGRQQLFFCIGEVSGQGMAAALLMSRIVSVLRKFAQEYGGDPSGLLSAVNAYLCEGNDANVFVALFCGYLNVESGRLRYANAGHCAPLLAWEGGVKSIPIAKGALLGAVANMSYLNCDLTLGTDDLLLCYTEGLTRAATGTGEEFGEARLLDLLARGWRAPLPTLVSSLHLQAKGFAGGLLQDDCTLLALRRAAFSGIPTELKAL